MFQVQQYRGRIDIKRQGTGGEKWNSRGKTRQFGTLSEEGVNTQIANPSELQGRTCHAYVELRMARPDAEDLRDSLLSIA